MLPCLYKSVERENVMNDKKGRLLEKEENTLGDDNAY